MDNHPADASGRVRGAADDARVGPKREPTRPPSTLPQPSLAKSLTRAGHIVSRDRIPRPLAKDRAPWERQSNESAKAFAAFITYLDLGKERSYARVAEDLGRNLSLIADWGVKYQWTVRVAAHEADVERRRREQTEAERERMLEAHAREVAAARRAVMEPIHALLKRLRDSSEADYQSLDDQGLSELVTKAVRSLAQLQQAERLARGLPATSTEIVGDPARPLHTRGSPQTPDLSRLSIEQLEIMDWLYAEIAGTDESERSISKAGLVLALCSWVEKLDPTAEVVVARLKTIEPETESRSEGSE